MLRVVYGDKDNTSGQNAVYARARDLVNDDVDALVVVFDDDSDLVAPGPNRDAQFANFILGVGGTLEPGNPRSAKVKNNAVAVHMVVWKDDGPEADGIPTKQTLERMVARALAEAHPNASAAVHRFLQPEQLPEGDHKHQAMAYDALLKPTVGSHEFFRVAPWDNPACRAPLERMLRACGAWDVFRQL